MHIFPHDGISVETDESVAELIDVLSSSAADFKVSLIARLTRTKSDGTLTQNVERASAKVVLQLN